MAQFYSSSDRYHQNMHYAEPPTDYWQNSSMSPPPYPCDPYDNQEHTPVPAQLKMAYYPAHHTPPYSEPHQEPLFQSTHQALTRPIAIPQIAPGANLPFLRAYSPCLTSTISKPTFLDFIDTLNIALANTPPLQILDLAGGFVGMVPHHIPALIGGSLQATAKIAGGVTSKVRSSAGLKSANETIFGPVGLKVEIVDTKTLKQKLGLDVDNPLLPNLDAQSWELGVQARRLHALEPYTSVLDLNVPDVEKGRMNAIDKLSAAQLKRQMDKSDQKAMEARIKEGKKTDRRAEKENRKAERKRRRGKEEKVIREKEDKESKAAEKLLWLFVEQV